MKLIFLFLAVTTLEASARAIAQPWVTLKVKNADLKEVFERIQGQTKYDFLYNAEDLKLARPVSISVSKVPIQQALDICFADQPIEYSIENTTILVRRKKQQQAVYRSIWKQVSGIVTDSSGGALAGATVSEKNTGNVVASDPQGHFRINVAHDDAVLIVSYIGYVTKEVTVAGRETITIILDKEVKELEQMVVVGYGTSRKKDLTGSVTVIGADKISNQTVPNAAAALQGKAAGVQVTNSGEPGSNPQIRIRGVGSVTNGVNPLYVVDGVIVNDIAYLGPNDIENISILKDASSAAIYGVRAANGVILITTRKGKNNQRTTVYADGYMGYKKPSKILKMANGAQYVELYNEKMELLGLPDKKITLSGFNNTSTNWYDEILQGSFNQSQNINLTGGSANASFNVGAGYLKDDGLVKNNKYQRLNIKANYDFKIGSYVKAGLSTVLTEAKANPWPGNVLNETYRALPVVTPYTSTGEFTNPNIYNLTGQSTNPVASLFYNHQWEDRLNMIGNAYIEVQPVKEITFRSNVGVNTNNSSITGYTPAYTVSDFQKNATNNMSKSKSAGNNIYWDNTATYEKTFNAAHHIKVLAGYSYQLQTTDFLSASARGLKALPSIEKSYLFLDMPRIDSLYSASISNNGTKTVAISYLSRINYDYKGKYLLTLTFRADGSSKFPANHRWGYFPSVGLGWNIGEETFLRKYSWINQFKLRGSYGLLGNNNIPSNIYAPTVNTGDYAAVIFGTNQNTGNGIVSYPGTIDMLFNPNLKWEVVREWDGGFDASLFNNRLGITFDYYHRLTSDAIFPVTDIGSSGLSGSGVWGNNADILNSGIELSVSWRETKRNWSYSIAPNITVNHNKIAAIKKEGKLGIFGQYDDTQALTYSTLGRPVGAFYGYKATGVFQNAAEVNSRPHLPGAQPGDLIFEDINNDKQIDASDRTFIGNPNPKMMYGLDLAASYRSLDLAVSIQGVTGNDIFNVNRLYRFGNENWDAAFYEHRWHGEGTSNKYPSALMANPTIPSSFLVEKGNYLRVKAVQMGYTIPQDLVKKAGISRARFYINMENPLTIFGYNGFSPEVSSSNPLLTGTDRNVYPLSSIYTFGFNLTF